VYKLDDSVNWDKVRDKLNKLEDKLNELTNGEFYGDFAVRGLETYKVREVGRLLAKYPLIREVLRECIIAHIEFYESYFGKPLTDESLRNDSSIQNILALSRHFGSKFSLVDYAKKSPK